jgi:hypothetical protein
MVSTTTARNLATTNINDNTTGDVTPADVRGAVLAILDAIDRSAGQIAASVLEYNSSAGDGTTDARAAIVSAMATGSTFFAAGTYRVNSALTITGVVYMAPGAVLKPASGVTVTFSGEIVAPRTKIFDTSLNGSFATTASNNTPTPITKAYPEWWGATGNVGNQSPFIQAAINFIQGQSGGTVCLNGWYTCQTTLNISGRIRLEGAGPVYGTAITIGGIALSTSLDFSLAAANTSGIRVQNNSNYVNGFQLVNVGMFRGTPEGKTATSIGLDLVATHHVQVIGCSIFGFGTGVQVSDEVSGTTKSSYDGVFDACSIGGGGKAAAILAGCSGYSFHDCTLYSGFADMDQLVLIQRGPGGMKCDTITFADSRIIYLGDSAGRPAAIVKIVDGMWINFNRTDLEEADSYGILVQRDATAGNQDVGLKAIDVNNCWFNNCAQAVVFSGFRAGGRISDCRMENAEGGVSNIAISFSSLVDADIVIRGNNIRADGTAGGITVANASGVRIMENYIYGEGSGAAQPGILLTATSKYASVIGNRVRSDHASPINNLGVSNTVASNITTTVAAT